MNWGSSSPDGDGYIDASPHKPMPTPLQNAAAALHHAHSWSAWKAAAEEHDRLSGAAEWRQEDDSPHYDAALLLTEIAELRRLRNLQAGLPLAELLTNSLYRHLGDLSAPALYTTALAGTTSTGT